MLIYRIIISGEYIISVEGVRSNGRRFNTHLTKSDWLIEMLSLLGVFVGFAFIAYGTVSLPAIVPTHVGVTGIDSYGTKWFQLAICSTLIFVFYGGITLLNRYLYRFYHPVDTNAPVRYHAYQDSLRVVKLLMVWVLAIFIALYIIAMPKAPGASIGFMAIILVLSAMCIAFSSIAVLANRKYNIKK